MPSKLAVPWDKYVRVHRGVRNRGKRQRLNESLGRLSHDDVDSRSCLNKQTGNRSGFESRDPAGDTKNDCALVESAHRAADHVGEVLRLPGLRIAEQEWTRASLTFVMRQAVDAMPGASTVTEVGG